MHRFLRATYQPLLCAAILTAVSGCPKPPETPEDSDTVQVTGPLRVLVVDDPAMKDEIERQWQARSDEEIRVAATTSEDLLASVKCPDADAIIYPGGLIGELAVRDWISPVDSEVLNDPAFARRDVLDLVRQREIMWGEKIYAVPLGSPTLLLVYRRDLFEKLAVQPPETWEQYGQLATAFHDPANAAKLGVADPAAWAGVVEPLGPDWASQVLLARVAPYIRHRSYFSTFFDSETMAPLIAAEPFVKALEELVAASKSGPAKAIEYTPQDAFAELVAGRCAMAMTWVSRPENESDLDGSDTLALGVTELPGSIDVYNHENTCWDQRDTAENGRVPLLSTTGRLGSVIRSSPNRQAALKLVLLRLSGPEWSLDISPKSPATTIFRTSQADDIGLWTGDSIPAETGALYAETLAQAYRRGLSVTSIRIPGRLQYLAALDDAVHRALKGEATSKECLDTAAAEFQKITEAIGLERQKAAYWASLGMEP